MIATDTPEKTDGEKKCSVKQRKAAKKTKSSRKVLQGIEEGEEGTHKSGKN